MKDNLMKKALAVCLALVLLLGLLPPPALADLRRGSKGEEVEELQTMLTEMGFLDDKIDGAYGKKTEAAVKRFQAFAGLGQTGRVDEETSLAVTDCYYIATGVMAGDGLGPEELGDDVPDCCRWTTEADGEGAVLCRRHLDLQPLWDWYFRPGKPERLERLLSEQIIARWTEHIDAMYDEWGEEDEDALDLAEEQRENFHQVLENDAGWAESDTKRNPLGGLQVKVTWIESQGIDLCSSLHGQQAPELPEEESP